MKQYVNQMKNLKEYDNIEEIQKSIKIPEKLYRYRALNIYTIDEIINHHVFLANPNIDDLFDTSIVNNGEQAEGVLAAHLVTKYLKENSEEMESNYNFYTNYIETLNTEIRKNTRIACFTESNVNVPMWQYYADKHTGVCLEYSISIENFEKETYLLPVIYTNEHNAYFPSDLGKIKKQKLLPIICSILKMEEWKFEKEWRIVSLDTKKQRKEQYVNLQISGIYCGVEMPETAKRVLKGLIDKKIPIYEMKKEVTGLEI